MIQKGILLLMCLWACLSADTPKGITGYNVRNIYLSGGGNICNAMFKEHHCEANHKQSISCSHISRLTETADHRIFAVTERRASMRQQIDYAPQQTDTIILLPGQRSVLEIRSTNGYGQWIPNGHKVVVIVKPAFWQTDKAKMIVVIIILSVVAAIVYTIYYILRIKRQRHETMEYYLALLDRKEETKPAVDPQPEQMMTAGVSEEDEAFMRRLLAYIEQNIGNSDASPKDMAAATATSRSSLYRKINRLTGMTPMDFLGEARIRKACQLLKENDMAIVDIAYACGYSDSKYFSKSFKKDTGKTPSQYRNDN